jgi:hypothetical protein
MEEREFLGGQRVQAGDRQFGVAFVEQAAPQEPGLDGEIGAAELRLDRDFPQLRWR